MTRPMSIQAGSYQVGIDLGTTYSSAAVCRAGEPRPEVVPLAGRSTSVASVVFLAEDGSLVVGEAAERRALTDPGRVVREFKRRIGDGIPVLLGGQPVPAETVAARFVAWILAQVAEREGGPASAVTLTHPAEWGSHKRDTLAAALVAEGLAPVTFMTEPQAAAIAYAAGEHLDPGAVVAVYDLGGGTFDAAIVRKHTDHHYEVLGRPTGIDHLGGIDFDQAVFDHVVSTIGAAWHELDPTDPTVHAAVAGLRRECTAAKEMLSTDTEVTIPVMLPTGHTQVRLTRAEFDDMVRPSLAETLEALRRAIDTTDVPVAELTTVLLVGGSSRIPLITQLLSAELDRPIAIDADPNTIIATGAALHARGPDAQPTTTTAPVGRAITSAPGRPELAYPELVLPAPVQKTDRAARRRTLLVAVAISGIATLGLAGTVASGTLPLGETFAKFALSAPGVPEASADTVIDDSAGSNGDSSGGARIDSWTGEPRTVTTVAGPHRPTAVAATAPPAPRTVYLGGPGASLATGRPAPPIQTGSSAGGGGATTGQSNSGGAPSAPSPSSPPTSTTQPTPTSTSTTQPTPTASPTSTTQPTPTASPTSTTSTTTSTTPTTSTASSTPSSQPAATSDPAATS